MAASLPIVPRLVFTIIEPLSLVAGFLGAVLDPVWFAEQQLPHDAPLTTSRNTAVTLALLLGNLYLLLAFIGLAVLTTTSEPVVVRAYLVALWLGDIGHVAFSMYSLGWEQAMDPAGWNSMAWGNIGFTVFLFTVRSLYFLGSFGPGAPAASAKPKRA
ncbi:hypothetical protein B0I35DRAFT_484096 [Stachybotrys elegans]|uniref:DUF7704 domain-containing protein n=1 Tax=Stachybotrys elegans TaxID=80388 RepID=A0A8K0SG00_9HYPO|nr:hypothetical protein B0I35DRAFT_484096 [Stachybotrys elegans]